MTDTAPQTGLALSVNLAAAASLNVDKHDMVAIVTEKSERRIRAAMINAEAQHRALTRARTALSEAIAAAVQAASVAAWSAAAATAMTGLAPVGLTGTYTLSGSCTDTDLNTTLRFEFDTRAENAGYGSGRTAFSILRSTPLPAPIADQLSERKKLDAQIADIQAQLLDLRRELSNLPSLERAATASLARSALSSTTAGQSILTALDAVEPMPLPTSRQLIETPDIT